MKKILTIIMLCGVISAFAQTGQGSSNDALIWIYKGMAASDEGNYTEAVKWFLKAAEQGNADAQFNVGTSYYLGQGVTQNYMQAVNWFRKAAEQGNAYAQSLLGDCYSLGNGVTQDKNTALYWYEKAQGSGILDEDDVTNDRIKELKASGYSSSRAKLQSQSSPATPAATPASEPSGKIKKVWLEYDIYNNGDKGMNIHVHFSINGMKGKEAILCAYIKDLYDKEVTSQCNGSSTIIPSYDSSEYKDFVIFKSYSAFFQSLPRGKTDLKVDLTLIYRAKLTVLDWSDYVYFYYTR